MSASMMKVQEIIQRAASEGRHNLLQPEAMEVCLAYDIPIPKFEVAASPEEAKSCAQKLGYPVALKVISPDILHKTDVGGVLVGLSSVDSVETGYQRIMQNVKARNPNARILGMLVQKMAPESTEVIVGSVNDPQFGPTILFGLGGIFVEVLKDVAFRIAPLEEHDARAMITEIKGYPVIMGQRGSPPVDQGAIVSLILNTSRLVTENPQIVQMDLNPVIVYEHGAIVVDARIVLTG